METITIELPKSGVLTDFRLILEEEFARKMHLLQIVLDADDSGKHELTIKSLCSEIEFYKSILSQLNSVW